MSPQFDLFGARREVAKARAEGFFGDFVFGARRGGNA
jgi:hypothetical protein